MLYRGNSPTTEIYLRPRFADASVPVKYLDITRTSPDNIFSDGTFVVIVRYLNPCWAYALARSRAQMSGVAYLVDDDIPKVGSDRSLPRDYARTVSLFWAVFRPFLARVVSEIWVTSVGLQQAYFGPNVHRMDPLYVGPNETRTYTGDATGQPVRVFYHGGRTHGADQRWLRDVIAAVQAERTNTVFEIFGDADIAGLYAGVPRCRVLQRLPWPNYLSYAAGERLDIGLAPAVAGAYNAARSFNKAYDITRAGAAGIYADVTSFREFVTHEHEGLLVSADDKSAWVNAILMLVDAPEQRRRLHAAALRRSQDIRHRELTAPLTARFRSGPPSDG